MLFIFFQYTPNIKDVRKEECRKKTLFCRTSKNTPTHKNNNINKSLKKRTFNTSGISKHYLYGITLNLHSYFKDLKNQNMYLQIERYIFDILFKIGT